MSKSWFSKFMEDLKGAESVPHDDSQDEEPDSQDLWIPYTLAALLIGVILVVIVVSVIFYF